MTREEEIERASVHHLYQYDYSYEKGEHLDFYIKGFTEGAKWTDEHPKNIWHDIKEEPKNNEDVVLYDVCGNLVTEFYDSSVTWHNIVLYYKATMWAYVSDILPKGGEK